MANKVDQIFALLDTLLALKQLAVVVLCRLPVEARSTRRQENYVLSTHTTDD